MIRITLIVYGVLSLLAVIAYLPKLVQFRYAFKKPPYRRASGKRKISVIIPARNESEIIGDLFASIQRQTYDSAFFDVNVIVKSPDDPTVELAKALGANVFVVEKQSCKGDALDGYFRAIGKEKTAEYAAFVIVDADAVLTSDYLYELNNALESEFDIFITRKFVKNYLGGKKKRTVFTNCSALTWPIIDDLGNKYRMQNNIPLNLCGQGMMLRSSVILAIGGWPYRTLTEDYELKCDSLLKGFKSMFYPYAVLYTEEAVGHRENVKRRLRWLTGYSQCDKKYKQQIKEQVKERGEVTAGEFEYLYGLYPLIAFAIVSILTMFTGTGMAIWYGLHGNELWLPAVCYLIALPFGVMYVLLLGYSVLALLACPEMFAPLSIGERLGMVLFNPFYLLEYFPIYLKSRVQIRKNAQTWEETERVHYDQI